MGNIPRSEVAPIVLFVYNRPWHTIQTLDALAKNHLASESKLFIYCDGPKDLINENDLLKIEETKSLVKNETRFKEVIVIESNINKGLAKSIIDGVTEVVNIYGYIIVLEDDIVTSKGFLKYMNDALNVYKDELKVMHISGYMYPINTEMPETFFLTTTSCWGWATWSRSWQFFEKNIEKQIEQLNQKKAWYEFTINGSHQSFRKQLDLNQSGEINTWAIFWYASVFLKGGTSLHPYPSLVQNIGFDGTGENCGDSDNINNPYYWIKLADTIKIERKTKFSSKKELNQLAQFFNKMNKNKTELSLRDDFYLLRKSSGEFIKKLFSKLFISKSKEYNKKTSKIEKHVENIEERYVSGVTDLFGKSFYYVDLPSFESTKSEVIDQEIYKFNTDSKQPVIIDCGANIGLSLIYFKKEYPNCKITAFEPDPKIFQTLKKNIEIFEFSDIELVNKALWSKEGEISFYSEGADGGRIDNEVYGNGKLITLQTTTLSSYLTSKIDFLKIDIEGAETEVLKECQDKLHLVDNIFIEYHSMVNSIQTLSEILQILSNQGFRYYISHIGIKSTHPFIAKNISLGMDNQLNIFGTKSDIE